jgi:nucleoside-diphosphate-sugar epimerase
MDIEHSLLWLHDLDETLQSIPDLSSMAGKSILVTGGTGLIGSALVDLLLHYNNTHKEPIKVCVAGRNQEKAKERFFTFSRKGYLTYTYFDALAYNDIPVDVDYVIDCAGNAYPALMTKEPVETMHGNIQGVDSLLKYSIKHKVKRLLYVSSSEVYGIYPSSQPIKEDQYGYVDELSPRSCYAMGKRASETLCISYGKEYGVESIIARPGHIYGPTTLRNDNRVSSSFAYLAAQGKDLVLKSEGSQVRSYCYCLDCATALLTMLMKGNSLEAYNISDPDSVATIRQLANYIAHAGKVSVVYEKPSGDEELAFNPMINSSLDSTKLSALGWRPSFSITVGMENTINILKEIIA